MGIETIALAAMVAGTGISAFSGMQAARGQAKAAVAEGKIAAENKAKETIRKAGAAQASFINSGFDLFGTPENAISGIFDAGQKDVGNIITNANKQSKNLVSKARNDALGSFLKMAGSMGMSGGLNDATGGGFNKMFSGNTLANNETVRGLSTGQSNFIGPLPR